MTDHRILYQHFCNIQITLIITHIIHGIPQTPFCIGKKLQIFFPVTLVGNCNLLQFAWRIPGHKISHTGLHLVFHRPKENITRSNPALITVQFCLRRLKCGIPDRILVLDKEIFSIHIQRQTVIAVSGNTHKFSITEIRIASSRIGNQ